MDLKSIYLTPEHPQLAVIEDLRQRFEPSADQVPAHITVVFPFRAEAIVESSLNELMDDVAAEFDPIEFSLGRLVCVNSYGFLPIIKGRRLITQLHDQLYHGQLSHFLVGEYPYLPHITVGRYFDPEGMQALKRACDEIHFTQMGTASEIVLETIYAQGTCLVNHRVSLNRPRHSDLEWLLTL